MSVLLKIFVALAVALPLAGYVAGSLVTASDPSPTRERIIIQDDSTPAGPEDADPRGERDPARKPSTDDSEVLDDGSDDLDDEDDGDHPPARGADADRAEEGDDETHTGTGGSGGDHTSGDDDSETDDDGGDDD